MRFKFFHVERKKGFVALCKNSKRGGKRWQDSLHNPLKGSNDACTHRKCTFKCWPLLRIVLPAPLHQLNYLCRRVVWNQVLCRSVTISYTLAYVVFAPGILQWHRKYTYLVVCMQAVTLKKTQFMDKICLFWPPYSLAYGSPPVRMTQTTIAKL